MTFRSLLLLAGVLLLAGCRGGPSLADRANSTPQQQANGTPTRPAPRPPLDHSAYARVLERFVDRQGLVDYRGLQQEPRDLEAYVAAITAVEPDRFASWHPSEQIAFLLNAYNALTLASIIEQEPIRASIRDIPGVWKLRRHTVAGEGMTLDHIEHGILRKRYDEPRIHAALVCAAISCPPLRREPYTGPALDTQLDDQSRLWLSSPQGLVIGRGAQGEPGSVAISQIFQWFGDDWKRRYATSERFGDHEGQRAILNYISGYVSPADQAFLRNGDYRLTHLQYDWSLNQQ
ncbi:conserved hypothetical protein [Cyanobium sp. PCC 7001]|uniref:DUF547 domain-containing protein n=1 Tax=Cyanobium sp. PCC 7001 TaxID=180281 RepID=UPI0001805BB5|nr:DUF547 domain-containing protein [Cyanobium sp. PCC 7001]EDY39378.1 conserved hypothetical protein [Cyanobium sp. PCC 7001]